MSARLGPPLHPRLLLLLSRRAANTSRIGKIPPYSLRLASSPVSHSHPHSTCPLLARRRPAIDTYYSTSPPSSSYKYSSIILLLLSFSLPITSLYLLNGDTPTRLDGPISLFSGKTSTSAATSDADSGTGSSSSSSRRLLSAGTVKQISLGSVLGLGVGVLLGVFSRSLAVVVGLGVVCVQFAARRGYNLIPLDWVQGYVRSIDLKRAVRENAAFKISFGIMAAVAAFGEF